LFDPELTDSQQDLAAVVRKACAPFDDAYWTKHDQEHLFPYEFFDAMVTIGVVGMLAQLEYGGGGATIEDAALALQEIAASGAGINGCSAVHLSMFGFHPVVVHGSEYLKSRYLTQVATGRMHVSFSVTEPDAGSDTGKISTRAIATEGGYLLRGRKIWMTKGLESTAALVLAPSTGSRSSSSISIAGTSTSVRSPSSGAMRWPAAKSSSTTCSCRPRTSSAGSTAASRRSWTV
jgi:acyl-CoA dehydrogenase